MPDTTYNGWSNYETWAVGMWLDGSYTGSGTYDACVELVQDNVGGAHERYDVSHALKSWVREENQPDVFTPGLTDDLLGAAFDSVNWYELADAWIQSVSEQTAS